MFLEVVALVCLLSITVGAKNPHVISYTTKENRALKVQGNPGSSCGLGQNPMHGSSECLIECLTQSKYLYGFGWNKNSSECRCCQQPVIPKAQKVAGEGWETYYLTGIFILDWGVFLGGRGGDGNSYQLKGYLFLFVLNKLNVPKYLIYHYN